MHSCCTTGSAGITAIQASQKGLPCQRSRSAKKITNAIIPPTTKANVGCDAMSTDAITIAISAPNGDTHISTAMISNATNHGGTVLRCRG
jgi:hypothetical protein